MEKIIEGGSQRYLSNLKEFKDGIPFGVVNKGKTDVGGTYAALNCNINYVIVCPYKDLVDSIYYDKNNKYEVFRVYGKIGKKSFTDYVENNKVKKIAVTYDSLPKLVDWIGEDIDTYKVLVDEYHLILEEIDFRTDAITNLMNTITKFNHYSFLSATPMGINYEADFLQSLPHYRVVWDDEIKITPHRIKCSKGVIPALTKFINIFLNEGVKMIDRYGEEQNVEQLFIFLNSVTSIKQICDTLELDPSEVKICCADRIRNKKLLGEYPIESISVGGNKTINFFTKKGYQGCNMFSNNGLIIVASDCHRTQTLVDIATTLEQIAGRLRENDEYHNCFRNCLVHMYSTSKAVMSDEDFETLLSEKERRAQDMLSLFRKAEGTEKKTLIESIKEDDIISVIDNELIYNEYKKQNLQYKQDLRKCYKDGFTIRDAYAKSAKFEVSNQLIWKDFDVKMKRAVIVSYEELLKDYLVNPSEAYELEYPEFPLIRRYLKVTEMNSLRWNKEKMLEVVKARQQMNKVYRLVYSPGFVSRADLKKRFAQAFKELSISGITPKATLIEDCTIYKAEFKNSTIKGKRVEGYVLSPLYQLSPE